ncbi:MAG TPA: hypothetical protein VIO94_01580 [Phenylobacterium sp.]
MPSSTSSSELAPAPDDGLVAADALAEAHRIIPERPWGRIGLTVLLLTLLLVGAWEGYWRSRMYVTGDMKNSSGAWAQERRRATGDATVLIGSSRNFYDVDLGVWEKTAGVRPVQLSLEGTSPRFALTDLANDPKFHGLVIADIVTGAFLGSAGGRRADVLAYSKNQSPSQRAGHVLTNGLDHVFAFLDDQTRPKEIWFNQYLPPRAGQPPRRDPYKLSIMEADRNSEMWRRVYEDEAYRQESIRIWHQMPFLRFPPPPEPVVAKAMAEVRRDVRKIRARGGDVVFVMHPMSGEFLQTEHALFPRDRYWDRLLRETHSVGVHWEDYPQMQGYRLPETSHLHPRDAEAYTAHLARILAAERARGAPPANPAVSAAAP